MPKGRPKGSKNKKSLEESGEPKEMDESSQDEESQDEENPDDKSEIARLKKELEEVRLEKEAAVKAAKPASYHLIAKFKGVDEEQNKVWFPYESSGKTLAEALKKLEFPPRIAAQIRVSVRGGEKTTERSFAPHKWNYLYESKDAEELGRLMGFWTEGRGWSV